MDKILTTPYKSIIVFMLCVVVFTCKENSKEKKIKDAYLGENLCVLLDKMREDDEKYRELIQLSLRDILNIINVEQKKLTKENRLSNAEIENLKEKVLQNIYADLTDIELLTIVELQTELDNRNTELLIDIIKNRGYPNKKNSMCKKYAGMVFRHSQRKYFDEIKILIIGELEKGNLNEASYNFFLDHINGRGRKSH